FYFSDPQNHFGVILDQMKNYAARRCEWIDQTLLSSYQPPLPPQIAFENPAEGTKSAVTIRIQSKFENPNQKVRWRLAEITDTNRPSLNPHQPWKYEIQNIWDKELNQEQINTPTNPVVSGHVYRVRARWTDASGRWSRWSNPVQFTAKDQ